MMSMFKNSIGKRFLVLISCTLLVVSLIGCSKGDSGTAQPEPGSEPNSDSNVKIQFAGWGDPSEKEVFTKLIKAFEDKNPTIKVDYLHIPGDYVGKMNTILAGGNAPDVFYVPDGDFGRWVSQDLLLPIEDLVKKSKIDTADMWSSGLDRFRYDGAMNGKGKLYALPKDIGPTVLFYNKDLFKKMNVPFPDSETPMNAEQLLDTAKKLTVSNNGRITQYGLGPIWWEGFILARGGKFLSDNKQEYVGNSSQETIDALQYISDLTHKEKVVPNSAALKDLNDSQMFKSGKLAMMTTGRWLVPEFRKLSFDWDVAPLPADNWGGNSGSVGLGIYSKTKHVDAAYKLVEFLGGPEGQKEQSLLGFSVPTFKSMANTDVFLQPGQKPEHAKVFIKAAETQVAGPWTLLPNAKWYDILNQGLAPVREGKKTASEALNELKPKIDAAIKEGNPKLFK